MIVHLVAAGDGRYEIEATTPESAAPESPAGFWSRQFARAHARWMAAVDRAQHEPASGRWDRWRRNVICRLNESVEEQRSLWALRDRATATLVHPVELSRD